jgi:sialic acid synthase SpsE
MKSIKIGNKTVGNGHPLYFIADIGANHEGLLDRAYKLIELAKEAGADAAKFQNFQASKIVSKFGFENLGSQLSHQTSWKKSVYEIYEDASIEKDWTRLLKQKCDDIGIDYFTSPYDFESVDLADPYVDLYKIGSGDITWIDIIEYISKKNKPVLIATGAATIDDVNRAVSVISAHNPDIVLMQCNTNYTVDADKYKYVNLNVLRTFEKMFPNVVLGLSDHTLGHATVVGAAAIGARVFEKHFTDDNDREGPDHKFAMNPKSWRQMVDNANEVYHALGDGIKRIEDNERASIIVQQRCLRATRNLSIGETIVESDLEALRPIPDNGIQPYKISEVVGQQLTIGLKRGEHITFNHIQ